MSAELLKTDAKNERNLSVEKGKEVSSLYNINLYAL